MRRSKLKAVGATLLAAVLALTLGSIVFAGPAGAQATVEVVEVPSDPGGIGLSVTWLTLLVAVTKAVSFVKSLLAKDWNAVLTLIVSVGVAIGLVFLVANSDFTGFSVPGLDVPLASAKAGTLALIGIVLGLAAAYGRDVLKSFDNTQSTAEPPLVT